jgi:hypothetical protein
MKKTAYVALAIAVMLLGYSLPSEAHFRGGIWVGPGWGPGWWGAPYPYPYPYPYYSSPPVVIRQEPQEYIQAEPQAQQQYWYFCPDPQGYYPYVKSCPKGWMRVVPTPPTPPAQQGPQTPPAPGE